jgi:hypothetical protein
MCTDGFATAKFTRLLFKSGPKPEETDRKRDRQLQGGGGPAVQYPLLQAARETAVANIKTRGTHDHMEQLTEVVGVAAGPNQGCSDGNTPVPSVSAP